MNHHKAKTAVMIIALATWMVSCTHGLTNRVARRLAGAEGNSHRRRLPRSQSPLPEVRRRTHSLGDDPSPRKIVDCKRKSACWRRYEEFGLYYENKGGKYYLALRQNEDISKNARDTWELDEKNDFSGVKEELKPEPVKEKTTWTCKNFPWKVYFRGTTLRFRDDDQYKLRKFFEDKEYGWLPASYGGFQTNVNSTTCSTVKTENPSSNHTTPVTGLWAEKKIKEFLDVDKGNDNFYAYSKEPYKQGCPDEDDYLMFSIDTEATREYHVAWPNMYSVRFQMMYANGDVTNTDLEVSDDKKYIDRMTKEEIIQVLNTPMLNRKAKYEFVPTQLWTKAEFKSEKIRREDAEKKRQQEPEEKLDTS